MIKWASFKGGNNWVRHYLRGFFKDEKIALTEFFRSILPCRIEILVIMQWSARKSQVNDSHETTTEIEREDDD